MLYHLIIPESGRLANEAFTSNLNVSLKQWLNGLTVYSLTVPKNPSQDRRSHGCLWWAQS